MARMKFVCDAERCIECNGCVTLVQTAAERVADCLEDLPEGNFDLLGPAPATILRIADRFRWQILLKYPPQGFLVLPDISELRRLCPQGISLAINVDPLNLS